MMLCTELMDIDVFHAEMQRLGYTPMQYGLPHWSGAELALESYAIGCVNCGPWLCDDANGRYTYIKRTYNDTGQDYFEEILTFESASAALDWVKTITKLA